MRVLRQWTAQKRWAICVEPSPRPSPRVLGEGERRSMRLSWGWPRFDARKKNAAGKGGWPPGSEVGKLELFGEGGHAIGDGVVLHEELTELGTFGDEEADGFVEFAGGEVDSTDEAPGVGGEVEVLG